VCSWFPAVPRPQLDAEANVMRRGCKSCRWTNRWNTWHSTKESSVPYTPIKETKEEKALCTIYVTGSTGEQIDECNTSTMEGWWHQHGITRSYRKNQSILHNNTSSGEEERVGVRQSRDSENR
jgi:hypothetical protein